MRLRDPFGSSRTRPRSMASGTEATTSRSCCSATQRSRKASTSGKFRPVSTWRRGNGTRAGANALRARYDSTTESLPPENSRHGRCISAATSRMIAMLSASSARSVGRA